MKNDTDKLGVRSSKTMIKFVTREKLQTGLLGGTTEIYSWFIDLVAEWSHRQLF